MAQKESIADIVQLVDSKQIKDIISQCTDFNKCNTSQSVMQHDCYVDSDNNLTIPQCPSGVLSLLVKIIASKPDLIDEETLNSLVALFQRHSVKLANLVEYDILTALYNGKSDSQTKTWIKYENLIKKLINCDLYDPSALANEALQVVSKELNPNIAYKFSSLLSSCVDFCRKSGKINPAEEEEQKWCEILEWMSWFLSTDNDELEI